MPRSAQASRDANRPGRDQLLVALSGLGILLVVIGHAEAAGLATFSDPQQRTAALGLFCEFVRWLQTFHMPLFFAISGYLLFHATLRSGTRPYDPARLVTSKAQRLLAPYLVLSSLAYLPKVWLSRFALRPAALGFDEYVYSLLFPWNNAIIFFWFLPTLFLMFCVAPWVLLARASATADSLLLAAGAVFCVLLPHENHTGLRAFLNTAGLLHNFIFFALGFIACKRGWLIEFTQSWSARALAASVSLALFCYARDNAVARLILALSGIGVACTIASAPLGSLLTRLGDRSFEIYLFSWFPQTFVKVVAPRIPQLGWAPAIVLSIIAGTLVPIAIVRCLRWILPQPWHFVFGREPVRGSRPVDGVAQ